MDDLEAPADDAAVAEEPLDLLGRRVGGYVEVLGVAPQDKIADAASYKVRLVAGVIEHPQAPDRVLAYIAFSDWIFLARYDYSPGFSCPGRFSAPAVHFQEIQYRF